MLKRLRVREGQSAENARRSFDAKLGMSAWAVPGREPREPVPVDPAAPWWWIDAEDASQSFLASMGVAL